MRKNKKQKKSKYFDFLVLKKISFHNNATFSFIYGLNHLRASVLVPWYYIPRFAFSHVPGTGVCTHDFGLAP